MRFIMFIVLVLLTTSSAITQQKSTPPCKTMTAGTALDFWIGNWDVYSEGEKVGTNRVEAALKGCAVFENWTSKYGDQGKSLFYFDAMQNSWEQIWVTENTKHPGGLKHKKMIAFEVGQMVRFQGHLRHPQKGPYLDRTTLRFIQQNRVRQLIEISFDSGATWTTTFDAEYRPKTERPSE